MKNIKVYFGLLVLFLISGSCTESQTFDVQYRVTFRPNWTNQTHPVEYPNNAHFSPMVVASHDEFTDIFEPGLLASAGMEDMAETGATSDLLEEIELLRAGGRVLDRAQGVLIDRPQNIEESSVFLGVDVAHSKVTMVSMIAPSPDWFVGFKDLELNDSGTWIDSLVVDITAYDAGTDNGITFTSANIDALPPFVISEITSSPLANNGVVRSLGTVTFIRVK